MMEYLVKLQSTVYAQVGIFLLLVVLYFLSERKLPTFRIVGFAVMRIVLIVALFIYLFLNWSSEVNPSLRNASVWGMFIVNLYMVWQVILTRMELPYREALEACGKNPDKPELFQNVIRTGRRFYNMRYFWQALVSGGSIQRFLHGIALEQLRYDFKRIFQKHGVSKDIINFQMAMAFLRKRLAKDDFPPEFKEAMEKVIDEFSQHLWVREQMNDFLTIVVESPEELYGSEWAAEWQEIVKSS